MQGLSVNFLSLQETKMVSFDVFVVKAFWGNMFLDFVRLVVDRVESYVFGINLSS